MKTIINVRSKKACESFLQQLHDLGYVTPDSDSPLVLRHRWEEYGRVLAFFVYQEDKKVTYQDIDYAKRAYDIPITVFKPKDILYEMVRSDD